MVDSVVPPSSTAGDRGFFGPQGCPSGQPGGRLNLLLSCAPWHPEPWADRLPPMLEPLGIQSYRADSARDASRFIETQPVHIAVVDLSLPLDPTDPAQEAGPRVLDLLSRLHQPPPILVIKRTRTQRDDARELAAALRAGAFAVLDRPRDTGDLELLLEMLRRVLCKHYQGRWPGMA